VKNKALLFCFFYVILCAVAYSQETIVKGRVVDADNGEGIPLANVFFKNSKISATTDFDGNYVIVTNAPPSDSLTAIYMGYKVLSRKIKKGEIQVLNFSLQGELVELKEVVVTAKEDPAYNIIRKVVANKDLNDRRKLNAYQYEMYKKVEIDIENISDKLKNKWYMRRISRVLDSVMRMNDESGKVLIPVYISETIEDYFYRLDPKMSREIVRAKKLTGIGMDDNSILSQLINTSFYDYNFYENRIVIMNKDFVSPIADGWSNYYEYILEDSMYIGEQWCYKIDVTPKRKQDLAFEGKIWIADSSWALKQANLSIGSDANLNFIDGIKINQELAQTKTGPWLPVKSRLVVDVGQLGDSSAGMLLKFYISNKNIVENRPQTSDFYREKYTIADTANEHAKDYWVKMRHDSLTASEKQVYMMIDSIKKVPIVRTYIETIDFFVNGYYEMKKVDLGPLLYVYAFNNVEGNRFQLGMRTNSFLNKNMLLVGRVAYGTKDDEWKYQGIAEYIFRRKSWSLAGLEHQHDIDQVALNTDNKFENSLFSASTRFGNMQRRRPYFNTFTKVYVQSDLFRGFMQKISFKHSEFDPLYSFGYYAQYDNPANSDIYRSFQTSEIVFESRYARNITLVKNGNQRTQVGLNRDPTFTFRYTLGVSNVLGSDLSYNKFFFNVSQVKNVGLLGRLKYSYSMGWTPDAVPYPILENHLGNQTYFLNYDSYNLMNFFEFTSDKYTSLHLEHHFDGLLFNRIPLLKKWKWREVVNGQILFGSVTDKNFFIIPAEYPSFKRLTLEKPYAEVSYGIENIFRLVRIDFIHRLTYLENQNEISGAAVRKFAVKVGLQFTL
jgi:hypothetical protein